MFSKEILGKNLKKLREEHKISQTVVGEAVGRQKTIVSRWENGTRFPEAETLAELAEFYDVSVDYLLGRTEKREINK
ncbi:MAG: helix-turn-helix transcriptional regulator [Eubacteriales bacterium]|nr:helix-turn-helix transcriptional regulator [Eubacteriales bacterium]